MLIALRLVKQPIWIGGILMKYLMVDNGRVFYSLDGSAASKNPIDQISKDDFVTLLKIAISEESLKWIPTAPNLFIMQHTKLFTKISIRNLKILDCIG